MTSLFQNGAYGGYEPLGASSVTFVEGTDFSCQDKAGKALPICFGIGAPNHQLLQQLQQLVNAFSTEKGFVPLSVDGFIGARTVAALATLGSVFAEVGLPFHLERATKENVTADAPSILTALTNVIAQRKAAGHPVAQPGAAVPSTKASTAAAGLPKGAAADVVAITTASSAAAAALPTKKSWLPWILGGLAAVAVVGGVGYVVYRRKARGT